VVISHSVGSCQKSKYAHLSRWSPNCWRKILPNTKFMQTKTDSQLVMLTKNYSSNKSQATR